MIDKKIGVLGGGQLGKMLCQDASKMGISLHLLEKDDTFPAATVSRHITYGDFKSYDDVYNFGKSMDIVTIEIEAVNTEALKRLESEGVDVYPQPSIVDMIKDKGLQKSFYAEHQLPTSQFELFNNADEVRTAIASGKWLLPCVQKSRTEGYDGQGVHIIRSDKDIEHLLDTPCLLEEMVDIDKEIAVIVARSSTGAIKTYPAVEMEFHPTANLVEFLFAPSDLDTRILKQADELSQRIAEKMGIVGLLAVELFYTTDGKILINEVAPRPHNSGHHTIEGNVTSQYEQHIRAIAGLPLGSTNLLSPSVMVNILGDKDHKGPAIYQGKEKCLAIEGAHFHIYGKKETKPFRKMGHVTIVDSDLESAKNKAKEIKNNLTVISK